MRIHILDRPRRVASPFERATYALTRGPWFPLVLVGPRLRECGIEIRFHDTFSDAALDCDLAIVSSRHHDHVFDTEHSPVARAMSVERLSRRARIAWMDLRDSSATAQFEVLPFVQTYAKSSLLRDRDLYRRPLYGGRIFTDYYHRVFDVHDDEVQGAFNQETGFTPLPIEHEAKLKLSWNLSYGFSALFASAAEQAAWLVLGREGQVKLSQPSTLRSPDERRDIALAAMLRTNGYGRRTIAFQRKLALDRLRDSRLQDVRLEPVPAYAYAQAMANAKLALSCFGNGEICYRENEAWRSGAAVVMPDMSHLQTFPPLYRAGVTYRAVAWDLSDLVEACRELLEDEPARLALAHQGQAAREALFSEAGLAAFTKHFMATFCGAAAARCEVGGFETGATHAGANLAGA